MKCIMAFAHLLVLFVVFSVAPDSSAAQCPNNLPSKNLNKFVLVLSAEMLAPDSGGSTLRFRPITVWKGPIFANYTIARPRTLLQLPAGLKLEGGHRYLLYLTRSAISGELEIAECSRTRRLETARDDLAVLSEGINAADYLKSIAEEDAFPKVEVVENEYINQLGNWSTDRVFRFPPNLEVTLEAAGPQGRQLDAPSYLSLEAQNLKRIDRIGPKDRRVFIALTDRERATFDTTDGVDAPNTELQIEAIYIVPEGSSLAAFADAEPKTGAMHRIEDAAGRLVGINLANLGDDFVLKLSWKARSPQPEPSGSWQDGLAALNEEFVPASTARDCQDSETTKAQRAEAEALGLISADSRQHALGVHDIFTARLQYAHGTITAVSSACNRDTFDVFPIAELQPTDIRTEVFMEEGKKISCVQVPCRRNGCGTTTHGAQTGSIGSLGVCVPFKPGVANKIAHLLRHVLTVLANEHAPTAQ